MVFPAQSFLLSIVNGWKTILLLCPISLDQLIGSGNWGTTQDQVLMEDQAIEQVRRYYRRAWEKIEVKGQTFFTSHLPRETIPAGKTSYQSGYPCHQGQFEPSLVLIFSYKTMTTKKRWHFWHWMAMIFFRLRRKLVKIKYFLKLQNRFFLHMQLRKSWLVKILIWSSSSAWETKTGQEKTWS